MKSIYLDKLQEQNNMKLIDKTLSLCPECFRVLKAKIVKKGKDITVVAYGDGFISALEAYELVGGNVDIELIDLVSLNPIDYKTISKSVKKTGRLLCIDTTNESFNIAMLTESIP